MLSGEPVSTLAASPGVHLGRFVKNWPKITSNLLTPTSTVITIIHVARIYAVDPLQVSVSHVILVGTLRRARRRH